MRQDVPPSKENQRCLGGMPEFFREKATHISIGRVEFEKLGRILAYWLAYSGNSTES